MSQCSDCYNGCVNITSDQCIKYTGIDIPSLEISNGDPVGHVIHQLTDFLLSVMNGTGVTPTIDPVILCDYIKSFLPAPYTGLTLNDFVTALVRAACSLDQDVTTLENLYTSLQADYTLGCLTGVNANSGTHAILQATITKLCTINTALGALALDVSTNYVRKDEINAYIANYLTVIAPANVIRNRMIPYVAVEYYGSVANFDADGKGIGDWEQVYLCNGMNGTPDKRGRLPVGAINGVPSSVILDSEVNPLSDPTFNHDYIVGQKEGSNSVILSEAQMPAHTHTASTVVTDPGHAHPLPITDSDSGGPQLPHYFGVDAINNIGTADTSTNTTGISVSVSNANKGGSGKHDNVPPVLACLYIMYIPTV